MHASFWQGRQALSICILWYLWFPHTFLWPLLELTSLLSYSYCMPPYIRSNTSLHTLGSHKLLLLFYSCRSQVMFFQSDNLSQTNINFSFRSSRENETMMEFEWQAFPSFANKNSWLWAEHSSVWLQWKLWDIASLDWFASSIAGLNSQDGCYQLPTVHWDNSHI